MNMGHRFLNRALCLPAAGLRKAKGEKWEAESGRNPENSPHLRADFRFERL